MVWSSASRLVWMAVQAVCTLGGLWAGCSMPIDNTPRFLLVPLYTAIGFFFGLLLTVVWVLLFEFLRYTVPGWLKALLRSA